MDNLLNDDNCQKTLAQIKPELAQHLSEFIKSGETEEQMALFVHLLFGATRAIADDINWEADEEEEVDG